MNEDKKTKSKLKSCCYSHFVRVCVRGLITHVYMSYINTSCRSYTFVLHGFSVGVSVGLLIGALQLFCQDAVMV